MQSFRVTFGDCFVNIEGAFFDVLGLVLQSLKNQIQFIFSFSPTSTIMEILCFFAGIAYALTQSVYLLFLLLLIFFFRPRFLFIVWFGSGLFWVFLHQWWISDIGMPKADVIPKATLQGYIDSLPVQTAKKVQFQFQVERFDSRPAKTRVLLTCYDHCPTLAVGQFWQLTAKLKKPRNLQNPGGFDSVSWLTVRHIHWTGNVRRGSFQFQPCKRVPNPLLWLREQWAKRLGEINPDQKTLGILQALTLGVSTQIEKEKWELFRRTGTIHLMVISGAHIGLVASLIYLMTRWIWSCFPNLCLRYPAQKPASLAALLMALIYAVLTGFGVPAERAFMVCFFMLVRNFCDQRFSVWQAWRYALLAVLLFEPHSVLMPGFYLSFIAVAVLVLINQRYAWKGVKKTIAIQVGCLFGLMPMTLFWFSYGAVNGLLANVVAIPWVGLVVVPLSLLVLFFGPWLSIPWIVLILKQSIGGLLYFLDWIDSLAMFNLEKPLTQPFMIFSMMLAMALIMILPRSRFILPATLLMGASWFPSFESVHPGEARIDILDVGQGLAVLVQTASHKMLYDTGVQFYQGSDMAKLAIIPYLNTLGIQTLDKVIISHTDLDHRGGLPTLEHQYSIGELIVDNPSFYARGSACHEHPGWEWDGVQFKFFPLPESLRGKNNHSCVLQVLTAGGRALLTGDIEKRAELYLNKAYGPAIRSELLLVPHHGSKTSSSEDFLKQVAPKYAVVSYGFDNRYHFPHPEAMKHYQALNIPVYDTVTQGKMSVFLTSKKSGIEVRLTKTRDIA